MGLFSSSNDEDKSVQELEKDIQQKDRELKKKKGDRMLKDLKKSKKQELKEKEKQLLKEEFKQTKAGKLIDKLGQGLGELAEATDNQKAEELARTAEKVDGDGKNDTQSAMGIGLENNEKPRDIEVEGNLEIEGDLVKEETKEPELFEEGNNDDSLF